MSKILVQLLTGKDGQTHDVFRWLVLVNCLTAVGLEIYSVAYKGQPFDMQAFGIGIGAVFTGAGAGLKLKESTEP